MTKINFNLISPPVQLKTKDPRLTIASDKDEATLDLRSLQPKLHKRLTKRVKAKHLSEILKASGDLFF